VSTPEHLNWVNGMNTSTRIVGFCTLLCGLLYAVSAVRAETIAGDKPEDSVIWQKLRTSLFQSRPIVTTGDEIISLETPTRAEDAAIVPIAIKAGFTQAATRYIDKVYLIIDNNPSPIAAIFQFTPLSGRADIETRVRIDQYTHVRAIAETNDGKLYMTTHFVKASGGCSAPPAKDAQAALANLGRMKFRVDDNVAVNQPVLAQLMISHPNTSGLAMDQVSRLFAPAHFVRQVRVNYDGQLVMAADVDISISENPNFRFYFLPHGNGELRAELVDSKDLQFETALKYRRSE
jgi:sulfur-oxidizing protein SoxY